MFGSPWYSRLVLPRSRPIRLVGAGRIGQLLDTLYVTVGNMGALNAMKRIGAEIAAWISEHCFEHLDAPVVRSASLDTPVPFASSLEWNFLPKDRFKKQLKELMEF